MQTGSYFHVMYRGYWLPAKYKTRVYVNEGTKIDDEVSLFLYKKEGVQEYINLVMHWKVFLNDAQHG